MKTLTRAPWMLCLIAVPLLPHPAAAPQSNLTGLAAASGRVALAWQGLYAPYLVQTWPAARDWCDQGELVGVTNVTLSAEQAPAFYRVRYLNPTNGLGAFYGLIQTEQGEGGELLGRHRLKSRGWFYKPQGTPSTTPAGFFRSLFLFYQRLENDGVTTFAGRLESLGVVATPGNADIMTVSWTNGAGADQRRFTLTLDFPYTVNTVRAKEPLPSDPYYRLQCVYATAQPELDLFTMTIGTTTTDLVGLVQLAQLTNPPSRSYSAVTNGMTVTQSYREGLPLFQGSPPMIFKTYLLDRWTAPTYVSGGGQPSFSTDSYFSRTLRPGHHNFVDYALIEPARDPGLSDSVREALRAANVRYVYAFKDIAIGVNPDDIRLIGFDNSIRTP